jgi:serine/threonine-protein kinase
MDFMAPEQALDSHAADIRSDLYGLGCTLYAVLTGRLPFCGRTTVAKLLQHAMHDAQPLEQLRPEIPGQLAQVIRRLMSKRPQDRYPLPSAALAALDTVTAAACS